MTTPTSTTIISAIKEKNIQPKSRMYFLITHAALWIPGILVTLLGAFAVAGILFASTHIGYEYKEFIYSTDKEFAIAVIPYIWVVSYILFSLLIVRALRTTHTGYKLSFPIILLSSFGVSMVLGTAIYIADSALRLDRVVRYPVHTREQKVWHSPLNGRLAGEILTKENETLMLIDKDGATWMVDISGLGSTTPPFIEVGNSVRVIGKNTEQFEFVACAVFPWDIGTFPRPMIPPGEIYTHTIGTLQEKPFSGKEECAVLLEFLKHQVKQKGVR